MRTEGVEDDIDVYNETGYAGKVTANDIDRQAGSGKPLYDPTVQDAFN
jgi:hypothetical protein